MTDADTATLRLLRDRAEIHDLLVRYSNAIDDREFERLRDCFTADAVATYNGQQLAPGVEAIIEYVSVLRRLRETMHVIGHSLIEVDGDRATADTALVAYLVDATGEHETVIVRGLRYRDQLVREAAGWRIRRRVHEPRLMYTTEAQPPLI